eukprot:TRINITY_DN8057_c0_g1_i5.p1 TRINITY_DN8057_c0_g1~~TRINITY_DN8057_c0_g1_i5.p1  ORF type:complete len:182 (+),score=25.65 TRINITY_DN8057_c0_g1_i5:115-660(+)
MGPTKEKFFRIGIGCVFLILQKCAQTCEGCKNGEVDRTHSLSSIRVQDLQHGVSVDLSEKTSLKRGDVIYGRFTVPYSDVEEAAIVTATWSKDFTSTPVWIFLRKGRLPDGNSFDKSSVNYISRRSSIIQLSPASPGLYYLRIECLMPLTTLQITTMVGDWEYLSKMQKAEEMEYLNEIDV